MIPEHVPSASPPIRQSRVAWTRGQSCADLANALAVGQSVQVSGDLMASCITSRVDILVTRRLTGFDLVPTLVPHGMDLGRVTGVAAAIGSGPHSPFAAQVAAALGDVLDVPAELLTMHRDGDDAIGAQRRLNDFCAQERVARGRLVRGDDVRRLVDALDEGVVLVVGAPGGGWWQRQFFGTGHRLAVSAPAGSIVAKAAPRRGFHAASVLRPQAIGLQLRVADAIAVMPTQVVPVADSGTLVGVVRRRVLADCPPDATVEMVMEPPVAVEATDTLDDLAELIAFLDGGPVPVVDRRGRLIGTIDSSPG